MAKKSSTVNKGVKKNSDQLSVISDQTIARVRDLAWTGQHAQAIDLASQALSKAAGKSDWQSDLLDLRAESYLAIGKLDLASKDAQAMTKIGRTSKVKGLQAQALNRLALVQMRRGDLKAAVKSAKSAVSKSEFNSDLRAESLFRLSEAQHRTGEEEAAIETAQKAIALFQAIGDNSGAGRGYWLLALAYMRLRAEDSRRAARTALELCNQAGDQYGIGNALVALANTDVDIAENIQNLQQARQAFETVGYVERQSITLINLGFAYLDLGLYPHSRRLQNQAVEMTRAMGAKLGLTYALANLINLELILGALDEVRLHLQEFEKLVPDLGDPTQESTLFAARAELALAAGDFKTAIRDQQSALKIDQEAQTGNEHATLTELGKMYLAAHNPAAALKATTKATNLHRAQSFAKPDGFPSQAIWWQHAQALNANQKTKEA
ncbi:MAG: hypothetical protein Q7T89_14480, partial [Anaerolineales bacterium]|nr:hypothetical protein [Anaerolineales bacterium]